jgi:formylglycine-generating enzyme required for sulfatase activity
MFDEYDLFARLEGRERPSDFGWGRGSRPVIDVSWKDAVAYAEWLSQRTGKRYRLPTEAEWEYAARGGTETAYWWGKEEGQGNANCSNCGSRWDKRQTAPVGSFKPNPFGLYDTAGNVSEWVQDCWHENYNGALADGSAWVEECSGDDLLVIRGGSWDLDPEYSRSSSRGMGSPGSRSNGAGFRLVQDIP